VVAAISTEDGDELTLLRLCGVFRGAHRDRLVGKGPRSPQVTRQQTAEAASSHLMGMRLIVARDKTN